jgi:alpha-1,2-mannosyltransferase
VTALARPAQPAVASTLRRHRLPLLVAGVIALGVVLRLGPLLLQGSLGGILEYDDAVYFGASLAVTTGQLPYADFTLVQPPGIVALLLPFAGLAHSVPDSDALSLARVAFTLIGAVNAALVMVLLRRYGSLTALAGGFVYATWQVIVSAEHTLLLEPLLNLCLLAAFALFWQPSASPRRIAAAGAILGVSLTFKLWPLPLVVVCLLWIHVRHGIRAAAAFGGAAVLSAALVVLPFLVSSPRAMYEQVVLDQLDRPAIGVDLADRLRAFAPRPGLLDQVPDAVLLAGAVALLAAALWLAVREADLRLWFAVLLIQVAEILLSASFYYHYAAFAGPALAVFGAVLAGRAWSVARERPGRRRAATAIAVMLAATLVVGSVSPSRVESHIDSQRVAGFLDRHDCTWASSAVLQAGDAQLRQLGHGCASWIDEHGVLLDHGRGRWPTGGLAEQERRIDGWQRALRRQFASSDAAVRGVPLSREAWSAKTKRAFSRAFRPAGRSGAFYLWTAR